MPPRKKTRGTLKRTSSDGPAADDTAGNSKRPRPDVSTDSISHISPDAAAAHRTRKPVTYKSRARQKAGLSANSPPKLTSFGFNVENRPKVGRALFHLSPSPRAKAKAKAKLKVFGSPKASRRRASKGSGVTSADNSRIEYGLEGDGEEVEGGPGPNSSFGTSLEHDEADDQPAPLPTLSAVRPIEGPGLEIRTPLRGRIIPPSLQSLSKRNPLTDATPIPLFAATPRHLPVQLPDDTGFPTSPTKPHNIPVFAPHGHHASTNPPVPSTPSHKPRTIPIFTPSLRRNTEQEADASPTKKPPLFAPTPSRSQHPASTSINPFAALTTPAHSHTLPTAPPALPTMSAALPAMDIPATPTTKGRSLPIFTPKLLFPPSEDSGNNEDATLQGVRGNNKVSKAPAFGVLEEDEESTPRANKQSEQGADNKQEANVEDDARADISMVELFDASTGAFSPNSEWIVTGEQGPLAPVDQQSVGLPLPLDAPTTTVDPPTTRVTRSRSRSRSRSASVSASGPLVSGSEVVPRAGSVARSRAGSTVPDSRAGSVVPDSQPGPTTPRSRRGSVAPVSRQGTVAPIPEHTSRAGSIPPSKARSGASPEPPIGPAPTALGPIPEGSRSASLSLTPLVTDPNSLAALKSQSSITSMDEYRTSQTAAIMMDTPGDERPSLPPSHESQGQVTPQEYLDPETSPLSSLPDDMSFSFLGVKDQGDTTMDETVGNTTAGDTTMRDAGETTVCNEPTQVDQSMQHRDPSDDAPLSPPLSPPAPTSPVSSIHGDAFMRNGEGFSSPRKQPAPSSSPTRPADVLVPVSDVAHSIHPGSRSRSSSLTSLSDWSDVDVDVETVEEDKAPIAETKQSMIPVPKRPPTPGPGPRAQTPGAKSTTTGPKTPLKTSSATPAIKAAGMNGVTPGPSRNGAPSIKNGVSSVKSKVAPTPGTSSRPFAPAASGSKLPALSTPAAGKTPIGRSTTTIATRTRAGATKVRSLAAPTASTAAKTRTKVVTAPPPRGRITSFMKPNKPNSTRPPASSGAMPPPPAPVPTTSPSKGQSKDDSDIRGPRRSMISQDTQASLSSLSDALEKLARPSSRAGVFPPRPGTSQGLTSAPRPGSSLGFAEPGRAGAGIGETGLRSSVGPEGGKPMSKSSVASAAVSGAAATSKAKGKAKEKDENGDDPTYQEAGRSKPRDDPNAPLRSCVIFVDVRTAEGEDAGGLFVDMLKQLGAKIVSRPTPSTTHIVFKSGHQSTLTKYKLYEDPQPFLVGIGWVVECVEKRARVGEENFMIKTDEVSALDLKKRRKSQLPHQMQSMARDPNPTGSKFGSMSAEATAVSKSLEASAAEVLQDAELAAERGKQRMQQKLFPRVRDRSPS